MNKKEILEFAVFGVKKEIQKRCTWIAEDLLFKRKTLEEIHSLIEKFDELNEKLASCCSEEK